MVMMMIMCFLRIYQRKRSSQGIYSYIQLITFLLHQYAPSSIINPIPEKQLDCVLDRSERGGPHMDRYLKVYIHRNGAPNIQITEQVLNFIKRSDGENYFLPLFLTRSTE